MEFLFLLCEESFVHGCISPAVLLDARHGLGVQVDDRRVTLVPMTRKVARQFRLAIIFPKKKKKKISINGLRSLVYVILEVIGQPLEGDHDGTITGR